MRKKFSIIAIAILALSCTGVSAEDNIVRKVKDATEQTASDAGKAIDKEAGKAGALMREEGRKAKASGERLTRKIDGKFDKAKEKAKESVEKVGKRGRSDARVLKAKMLNDSNSVKECIKAKRQSSCVDSIKCAAPEKAGCAKKKCAGKEACKDIKRGRTDAR